MADVIILISMAGGIAAFYCGYLFGRADGKLDAKDEEMLRRFDAAIDTLEERNGQE